MSNIDFSRLISPSEQVTQQATCHEVAVKAECKRRIFAQFSQEAQRNITQALALYSLGAMAEATQKGKLGNLCAADIAQVRAAWDWVEAMQAVCRLLSQTPGADPFEDNVWPIMPETVVQLIMRH
jgi:hypothetical protein